jgi:hypothetical protein
MATRASKERPYQCQLCDRPVAKDELGFVCQHVAHGFMLTLVAEGASKGQPIPDTPCTACAFAMEAQTKNAEEDAKVHVVCEACYREARARNIDYFTEADRKRGYVLVPRAHYERIEERDEPLRVGPLKEGRTVKLGFSPIPCTHPISFERMWVKVTCVMKDGEIHGALANDPALFGPKTLKADDTVVFTAAHVLDVEPNTSATKKTRPPKSAEKRRATR